MSLYLLFPLLASILCSVFAGIIVARDPRDPDHRLAATLVGCVVVWSFFEVLLPLQADPEAATWVFRATAAGWVWIPGLFAHLAIRMSAEPLPRLRAAIPWAYGSAAVLFLLALTPWMFASSERVGGSWSYNPGPLMWLAYVQGQTCFGAAVVVGYRSHRRSASPAEREQMRWLGRGVVIPVLAVVINDGVLPALGMHPPRIGTLGFTVLAGMTAWSFQRYGFSLLAPGTFAREMLETLPEGVAMLRVDGRVRSANHSMERLLGCEAGSAVGVALPDHLSALPQTPDADVAELRCTLRALDGSERPVEISTSAVTDRPGNPVGRMVVVRDLEEVEALRHRLILSGRLAAVGELAAGIAHEINNPLTFVRSNLSLLREHWELVSSKLDPEAVSAPAAAVISEGEELIDEALEGVDRAVSIVRDVRGLAHGGGGARVVADVHELLDGVLRLASAELRHRAVIETDYGPSCSVACAPQELQQVFLNLVINAGQALGDTGQIRLITRLEPGDTVEVRVADDGCGIPPAVRDRVFDPFFTTKPVGEGTGLGLSIAFGIVRSHGGDIRVEDNPGGGTLFAVRLPVAGPNPDPDAGAA